MLDLYSCLRASSSEIVQSLHFWTWKSWVWCRILSHSDI